MRQVLRQVLGQVPPSTSKVRVREAPGTREGGHLGRRLCRRRMRNEVLAEERKEERDMERAGGGNDIEGAGGRRVSSRLIIRIIISLSGKLSSRSRSSLSLSQPPKKRV